MQATGRGGNWCIEESPLFSPSFCLSKRTRSSTQVPAAGSSLVVSRSHCPRDRIWTPALHSPSLSWAAVTYSLSTNWGRQRPQLPTRRSHRREITCGVMSLDPSLLMVSGRKSSRSVCGVRGSAGSRHFVWLTPLSGADSRPLRTRGAGEGRRPRLRAHPRHESALDLTKRLRPEPWTLLLP